MGEITWLPFLRGLFAASDPSVIVGAGPDDCAHFTADGRRLAASTDAFVEGSHFLAATPPEQVAEKALGASVSDLAASACRARWALTSLCLRPGLEPDWAERFAGSLKGAAAALGLSLVGGDTVSAAAGVFVSITIVGEPLPGGPLLRRGARPGDILVVTGEFGGSILGRHLRPRPRLREITALMEFSSRFQGGRFPSAGMDVSDGLSLDLSRLCRESGVGAEIDAAAIPLSPEAALAGPESTPLGHALTDGEDFELLLTLPPELWSAFSAFLSSPRGAPVASGMAAFTAIGRITDSGSIIMRNPDGGRQRLEAKGYEHKW